MEARILVVFVDLHKQTPIMSSDYRYEVVSGRGSVERSSIFSSNLSSNLLQSNTDERSSDKWSTVELKDELLSVDNKWSCERVLRVSIILTLLLAIYGGMLFNSHVNYSRKSTHLFRRGQCASSPPTLFTSKYAVVVDAGSTGSRVHVYEFQFCGSRLLHLIDELFEQVKPGLSSFSDEPGKAVDSLAPLLKKAWRRVPRLLRRCTPVVVKATAGLRLLPKKQVEDILGRVRNWLDGQSFHLSPNPVSVIDGSEEAVTAWISVNFLNGRIGPVQTDHVRVPLSGKSPTWIVLEMGGGSTQIVFDQAMRAAEKPENVIDVNFFGAIFHLYQQSYLGYGLMEARRQAKIFSKKNAIKYFCGANNFKETIDGHALLGEPRGWSACRETIMSSLFAGLNAQCAHSSCSFNGLFQPKLPSNAPIYVLSYVYDRARDLGLPAEGYTLSDFKAFGEKICSPSGLELPGQSNLEMCFDIVFIHTLLHDGFGVEEDRRLVSGFQINGYETGWTLGSALSVVEHSPTHCYS